MEKILRNYCSYIVLAVACLCIGGIIGYNLQNLHDDGGGNVSTRQQVESAAAANQEHQASAGRITSSADRVEVGIEQAQDGISQSADRAASSEQLIGECQQILAGIRTRGSSHPPSH
ncbi:MAG: hypothetical protein Q3982_04455 [Phoenicibacter congonensis]|uniref:Uncharacterized protein n=1 Tax=Phoenicibacter congonensis TaxID=1944646 RepID=A0AA43RJX6_9ACTN|nr:hypothetical protein [Phoenicibacter congonensis]